MPVISENEKLLTIWNLNENKKRGLIPSALIAGSVYASWICTQNPFKLCKYGCSHTHNCLVGNKIKGSGCPFCSTRRCCVHNSIYITHSHLMDEWDYEKNEKLGLDPKTLSIGSNKLSYWICTRNLNLICKKECVHQWPSAICNRKKTGCPFCSKRQCCIHNSIYTTHSQLMIEWDYEKNEKIGLDPKTLSYGSGIGCHWKCRNGHEKFCAIQNRTDGNYHCKICSDLLRGVCHIDLSIYTTHYNKLAEWDYEKNEKLGLDPKVLSYGSGELVNWICKNGHEKFQRVQSRILNNCGDCYSLCDIEDSIHTTHPQLILEWDYEKNVLDPTKTRSGSHSPAYWICKKCDCKWSAIINSRALNGNGCSKCKHKTEVKLFKYLEKITPVVQQYKQDWCKKRRLCLFDFCIPELKLIIELDGAQHFRQISNWDSPTKTLSNDIFKMKCALENGYSVIRLLQEDAWNNDELWLDKYLKPHLKLQEPFTVIYISTDDVYGDHIVDMGNTSIIQFE